MKIKYTVTELNLAAGFCVISVLGPDGVAHDVTVDTARIAVSEADTEAMLSNTLAQVANDFLQRQYPLPSPQPLVLEQMVGKTYEF